MANTYCKMYIQAVYAVKYRRAVIHKDFRSEMMAVIGNLINETGCETIAVNGVEDHVHCFFWLKPSVAVSDVMKISKAKSSKWLNEMGYLDHRFEWQRGFGSFSYSADARENVINYINRQEEHHKKETFKVEYVRQLEEYGIEYDEEYLFEDLI